MMGLLECILITTQEAFVLFSKHLQKEFWHMDVSSVHELIWEDEDYTVEGEWRVCIIHMRLLEGRQLWRHQSERERKRKESGNR